MNFKIIIQKAADIAFLLLKLVNPVPEVGGIEISDTALRYAGRIQRRTLTASLRLPPGIIQSGVVKDGANFVAALKKLHAQIVGDNPKTEVYVVVSLPSEIVYSQVFNIPILKDTNLENAVQLNLEMISPLKRGEAYSSSEQVGTRQSDGFQLEFLGAFAESEKVDHIERWLFEAGFVAVVAEFPARSLARMIMQKGQGVDFTKPLVVLDISSEGVHFLVLRNKNLYFHYYIPWKEIRLEDHQITPAVLRELIQHNLQQVLNFHMSRWGTRVENVMLITPGLENTVKKIIADNFHLNVIAVSPEGQFSPEYLVARGAALRGEMPRSEDTSLSLLRVGTKDEFLMWQTMNFVNFWRTFVLTAVSFLLVVFGAGDALIAVAGRSIHEQNARTAITADVHDLETLEGQATEFNNLVAKVKAVKVTQHAWSGFFEHFNAIALANKIVLKRIFFQSFDVPVLVDGSGPNEEAVLSFKNLLAAEKNIQNLDLPLTSLESSPGGTSFSLRFKLTSLANL